MTDSDNAVLRRALMGGELLFRQLADLMPHLVWTTTPEGACDFLSRRWLEFTGAPLETQLGIGWVQQIHPDDSRRAQQVWNKAVQTGNDFQLDFRIRRSDGEYRWFDTRAIPVRDADGTIVKWLGTNTDVHDTYVARTALQQNEERLRYVTLATHDAIYDWDVRAGMTYRSEASQKLFGVTAITGSIDRWWEQRVHPADRARVAASAGAAFLAQLPIWADEYRLLRADNVYAYVADRAYMLYDGDNKPVRMIGAIADITKTKEVEQSLRDAQARLLSAMEAGGFATWIWNIEADELLWDDAAYLLWGRTPDNTGRLSLQRVLEMMHPEDRERVSAAAEEFFRTGYDTPVEFRTIRPDGALQWLMVKGQIERDASDKPVRMTGVYMDITKLKSVEHALRDSQARLQSAMQAAGLATWIWDIVNDEFQWDDDAYRLWGRTREQMGRISSSHVIDTMHPDDQVAVRAMRNEFKEHGHNQPTEFRIVLPNGAVRWIMAKGQYEIRADGKPVRMVGVYLDITERKRAEELRLNSQKMEALGTLAGGIAHDFNNILLAISGNAKLASAELQNALSGDHPARRNLTEIDKASARAADLVRRILMFSHQQDAKRSVTPLKRLVEDALLILRPTLPAYIEIRTDYDDATAPVAVDAIQIQQVVMNLVTNAYHAIGDASGVITIAVHAHVINPADSTMDVELPAGSYACLSVTDTGCGMDAATIARIFDPFFTTKEVGKGTGLGMAIVHGIVTSYDGAIAIQSDPGHGTTIRVYFPASAAAPTEAEQVQIAPPQAQGERVLYVDDEEALIFLMSRVLERLGYRVTACLDPAEAVKLLQANAHAFDVLVTDLSMRGMNGFELARAAHAIRADLPIVMTSGYVRSEDREMAKQCAIREVILKPSTVEELGAALDRVLHELRDKA
jgi:PAS domain S-box-containing protein